MRFSNEEMIEALITLRQKMEPGYGFMIAYLAMVPAIAFYFAIGFTGKVYFITLFLPPLIIGFAARFVGQTYLFMHLFPIAVLGTFVYFFGCFILGLDIIYYLASPIAFLVTYMAAKKKLAQVHIWALDQEAMEKIDARLKKNQDPSLKCFATLGIYRKIYIYWSWSASILSILVAGFFLYQYQQQTYTNEQYIIIAYFTYSVISSERLSCFLSCS